MIKVSSKEAAWKEADKLFPTDYEKDERATANAGYPIYMSAAEGNNSWISDLGTSLELNIQEGKAIKTIRICVDQEPEIIEEVKWTSSGIRHMCINHDWYTAGDNKAYSKMLDFVEDNDPTRLNIYKVAKDILDHSSDPDLYVEAIMFSIHQEAVNHFYTVK